MKHPSPTLFRVVAAASVAFGASVLAGCASTPSGLSSSNLRELTISMTVAGQINPADYYFVVFNTSNSTTASAPGPYPPIAPDWGGNGWVTGAATQYVEFNNSIAGEGYGLGQITTLPSGNLQPLTANPGLIVNAQAVTAGSNTLAFTIPLSDLEPTGSSENITAVQINFINTNTTTPSDTVPLSSPKYFDALGNTLNIADLNEPITIPTSQDGTYNNETITGQSLEPTGQDVAATIGTGGISAATGDSDAPNLDIINWSVQVTD